jgi:2-C-methyl-D-erythritol 2,4-cyclodiphosphate synthase
METDKGVADMFRIGQGFDVHQLTPGRPLIIGGITIPFEQGLLGHSDADVLLHTVADACLGAIGAGDIGKHFAGECRLHNYCPEAENGTVY